MPGDSDPESLFNRCTKEFDGLWRKSTEPPLGGMVIQTRDYLGTIRRHFSTQREVGGAIGKGWVQVCQGRKYSVTCPDYPFIWHSHPQDDEPYFSTKDWLQFLISRSSLALLITRRAFKIYSRITPGREKKIGIRKESINLSYLRLQNWLEERGEIDLADRAGVNISESVFGEEK